MFGDICWSNEKAQLNSLFLNCFFIFAHLIVETEFSINIQLFILSLLFPILSLECLKRSKYGNWLFTSFSNRNLNFSFSSQSGKFNLLNNDQRFKNSYSFVHRYMKNDLNRLQLHCKNREYGCEMVCSLESIDRHERECEYSQIPCSNAGE